MTAVVLNVAQIIPCTEAEGPSRRFALWFQGCPLRCPGCCNPEMLPFSGGKHLTLDDVLDQLDRTHAAHQLDGITLLGGEPLAHAAAGAALAKAAHERALGVMVFTGYTLEAARALSNSDVQALLDQTDLLVDGPFIRESPETRRRWIGSSNQRIHFLSDRYCPDDPCWRKPNTLEIRLANGALTVNGFPALAAVGLWKPAKERYRNVLDIGRAARLSRFEVNLLRILEFFLGRLPSDQALPLIDSACERPPCLSRRAVELIQDTLAKGITHRLARGGWRRERFLRDGRPVQGRLWERTPPEALALRFSRQALDYLMWCTAENPAVASVRWWRDSGKGLTLGDQLLMYRSFAAMQTLQVGRLWPGHMGFPRYSLVRLTFPEAFAPTPRSSPVNLLPWTSGPGAFILEAMQDELAERWLAVERSKALVADWQQMQALGREQAAVLDALFQVVEQSGRLDLARFLLVVLRELLPDGARPADWQAGLRSPGPRLADRAATQQATFVLLHRLERLRGWQRQARSVGYFDEGYAAAQLWLADWERFDGDRSHQRASLILRQVGPLATTGGPS